ncbi:MULTISPECIES: hypothetical protein [unclassified Oceanobacter]|uniref:hypothetical protein n=1 Tax=unclassified Oceanobacter TaxID=2620260 RepID=UPI002732C96B|nr:MULTISPECIES: hypothetical protein [unclassified Oceanobacter]MDP2505581.1 hypothetical protein [Oceanobacter sp. 3_MG-2023]MDP2547163.1 hypothetical protein [Oceanobacter sp. 4_MG-2023]
MKSIPETIRDLFGIDSAEESTVLKDKANSFRRNHLLKVIEKHRVQRKIVYLVDGQEVVLFNALLLSSIFHDPKHVKKIFEDRKTRNEAATTIRSILLERSNVCGIALTSAAAQELVACLENETDLYSVKLPNPFEILPQIVFGKHTNLLNALFAQASVLDPLDSVLAAYVSGDIDKACYLANKIENQVMVKPFVDLIRKQNKERQRFSKLLENFL